LKVIRDWGILYVQTAPPARYIAHPEMTMMTRNAKASLAKRLSVRFFGALALISLFAIVAAAQQPAPRKPTPRMTSDDMVQPVASSPVDAGDTTADAKADPSKGGAGAGEKKTPASADEVSWRERVKAARSKAKELDKSRDEAELKVTELRNELGVSGRSAQDRNQTVADMDAAGVHLNELRNEARDANTDLKDLVAYGKERGYSEEEGPKATTGEGKANEDYYRGKYAELNEELQTADRQVQLCENRVRDLQQRILNSGGAADNFTLLQLQQDKTDAQKSLEDAQAAKNHTSDKIESLKEEARRAGLPPGIFR
jgi:hypothetical protein